MRCWVLLVDSMRDARRVIALLLDKRKRWSMGVLKRTTHRTARQRMQRFSAMYTLSERRQGRGGLKGLHATMVSSTPNTSSLRC